MESIEHFVYALCLPDGTPFYVGKGTGNRIWGHSNEARKNNPSKTYQIIRGLWENGQDFVSNKLFITTDEDLAYRKEREIIDEYSKLYPLTNIATGKAGRPTGSYLKPENKKVGKAAYATAKDWTDIENYAYSHNISVSELLIKATKIFIKQKTLQ